jgi:DNA polymerase-3 subunit delta'
MAVIAQAEAPPEPDRAGDAPHPRHTPHLFGQEAAEAAFLDAFTSERLHHGWLLTGPRGIGKATFAWRAARFLLSQPAPGRDAGLFGAPPAPGSLDTDPEHPVARRMAVLSEPGNFLLRRPWNDKTKKLSAEITVDATRALHSFFHMSASDGGRRTVIVDAADELNTSAANALLKALEEPPARTTLFLIAHQPARLLPTIRSRCRTLPLAQLSPEALARALQQAAPGATLAPGLAALAQGSVGTALRMTGGGGLEIYGQLLSLWARPAFDRATALRCGDACVGAANAETYALTTELIALLLARLARTGLTGAPTPAVTEAEPAILARLAPHDVAARSWATLAGTLQGRIGHARAVNLDPASVILDTLHALDTEARRWAA